MTERVRRTAKKLFPLAITALTAAIALTPTAKIRLRGIELDPAKNPYEQSNAIVSVEMGRSSIDYRLAMTATMIGDKKRQYAFHDKFVDLADGRHYLSNLGLHLTKDGNAALHILHISPSNPDGLVTAIPIPERAEDLQTTIARTARVGSIALSIFRHRTEFTDAQLAALREKHLKKILEDQEEGIKKLK